MKKPSRCHKCIRKAAYKLVDKWYCKGCYCGLVEQKIRAHLRRYKIKRDSRLLVSDAASSYVVGRVVNVPVSVVRGKKQADYLVMPWTMDDENEEFLSMMFRNKKIVARENKKVIKLFYPLSKKEMKQYFVIKKVPYRPAKSELNALMDAFEDKHPGTKSSLLRSEERLKRSL